MKKLKIILVFVAAFLVLWSAAIMTDVLRCNDFKEPVFARETTVSADGLVTEYDGFGYTVTIRKYINSDGMLLPEYAETRLFGILISGVIV